MKVYSLSVKIEMVLTLTYLNKLGNSVKVKREVEIVKEATLSPQSRSPALLFRKERRRDADLVQLKHIHGLPR